MVPSFLFVIYLLSALSATVEHSKSFISQDDSSFVYCIKLYKDSILLNNGIDVVQKDVQTGAIQRTFRGHSQLVGSFAVVSNDLMVSTSSDNLLIIWDLVSGAILKRISYAGGNVAVGSLSYWKNFVVIGSQEFAVYLVDIDLSRAVRNYNTNGVVYAVLAVEGYFYVGKRSIPRVVKVRTETGVISKVYSGNTQTVLCLALYNNILFAGDTDNLIVSYDEVTAAVLQVLVGHDDRVFCLNIYEDLLYSGGWGNDLVVWNIEDGSIIKKIPFLHRSAITALAVNKDSIFTGSLDTEVSRLNSTSYERLFVYKGRNRSLRSVAVWKNTLISGGDDWTMRLWDLKSSSLNPYRVFTIDTVPQFCLHVKNDYVFGSGMYSMLQWDMITLSLVQEFAGHEYIVVSITSIDDYVFSGSYDQTVKKWRISSGELIYNFDEHSGPVENIFISDSFLFVGCMDGTVNMWLLEEQAIIAVVQPTFESIDALLVDGGYIYIGSFGTLVVDINSLEVVTDNEEPIECKDLLKVGNFIFSGHSDSLIKVRALRTLEALETYRGHSEMVIALCLDEAENFYSASFDGTVKKWNFLTRRVAYSFENRNFSVSSLAIKDNYLSVGLFNGDIIVYDSATALKLSQKNFHEEYVTSLVLDGNGTISTGYDGFIKLHHEDLKNDSVVIFSSEESKFFAATVSAALLFVIKDNSEILSFNRSNGFKLEYNLQGLENAITSLAVSDLNVFAGTSGGRVLVWRTEDGSKLKEFIAHNARINFLLVTDGFLVSASDDRSIVKWESPFDKPAVSFKRLSASALGNLGPVNSIAVCDGYLYSAGSDISLRRWDFLTGNHLQVYFGHSKKLSSVACFNGTVFTGSEDFSVLMYVLNLPPRTSDLGGAGQTEARKSLSTKKVTKFNLQDLTKSASFAFILPLSFGIIGLVLIAALVFLWNRVRSSKKGSHIQHLKLSNSTFTTTETNIETIVNTSVGLSKHAQLEVSPSVIAQIKKITAGGGGEVYLAKMMDSAIAKKSGAFVIQKIVFTQSSSVEDSFHQEVAIMVMLSKFPYFCELFGFTVKPFSLILKYYPDGSLSDFIVSAEYSRRFAIGILRQIGQGLFIMHERQLAHCDIKPQNVLVERVGHSTRCFLTDFGITQVVSDSVIAAKTFRIASLRGLSVHYASPESFRNFRTKNYLKADFKKYDIYSSACVCYELLVKKCPWN